MTHDVSDDEVWNGLQRRFAVGERLISRPASWGDQHTLETKPARRPTRVRVAGAGSLIAVGAAIILLAVALGPGSARRPAAAPTSSATAPVATPGTTGAPIETATNDALSLSARLDRTSVEPGGKVTVDVTIHNGRSSPVVYSVTCDSATTMTTNLPLPLEPAGRTWTGIEGDVKEAALGRGTVTGETPDQMETMTYSGSCDSGFQGERTLDPGETITSTLVWSADFVSGVPALPGEVPFTITFAHDRLNGPPTYPPGYQGPIGAWIQAYKQLSVTGHIEIVGQAPSLLSKGQAIDAVLSDPRFARWLTEQPESTWSTVNMLLGNFEATSVVPAGPNWELDLFREQGVPRNFAFAFVDPFTGAVELNFCEVPCSR